MFLIGAIKFILVVSCFWVVIGYLSSDTVSTTAAIVAGLVLALATA